MDKAVPICYIALSVTVFFMHFSMRDPDGTAEKGEPSLFHFSSPIQLLPSFLLSLMAKYHYKTPKKRVASRSK